VDWGGEGEDATALGALKKETEKYNNRTIKVHLIPSLSSLVVLCLSVGFVVSVMLKCTSDLIYYQI
jgi:hypothetical protein